MLIILSKILVIFIIAAVGLFANKIGLLPSRANDYFMPLLVQIAAPCLLLDSITATELTPDLLNVTLTVLLGSLVFFVLSTLFGILVVRVARLPRKDMGVYVCLISLVNNGFMGFPIAKLIFGDMALYLMVLSNVVMNCWIFTFGFVEINLGAEGSGLGRLGKNLKEMINPCSVCSLIGVTMLFSGLKLPDVLQQSVSAIGQLCVPLSMMVVGIQLGNSNFKELARRKDLLVVSVAKLLILPLATLAVTYFLPISNMAKLTISLSSAFPSAVITTGIAAMERRNVTLTAEGIAHNTMLSIFTLPLIIFAAGKLFL